MKLYSYFRSSASYRVRIALNLKGLSHEVIPIHLIKDGGGQHSSEYRQINPDALVPTLVDGPQAITQSLAIIEYLEELHPIPALLPVIAADRAFVRSIALAIACEIHPLNNLRVLRYLENDLKVSEDQKNAWYRHWCEQGLGALEIRLSNDQRVGKFCFGDLPTIADCLLVPQIFNAQRMGCNLSALPTIMRINDRCVAMRAFADAAPASQSDAE